MTGEVANGWPLGVRNSDRPSNGRWGVFSRQHRTILRVKLGLLKDFRAFSRIPSPREGAINGEPYESRRRNDEEPCLTLRSDERRLSMLKQQV